MKNLDDVLKKSLTPAESEEGPDFWLNQNILKRADRQERGAKTKTINDITENNSVKNELENNEKKNI